jgi:hypothetical protein
MNFNFKKLLLLLILIFLSIQSQSQTYIKGNLVTALALVPNIGVETSIGEKSTFQFDITASFWKSINGAPAEFYIFVPEYRYHFHEKFNGLYIGGNMGATIFNFQKWSNWDTNQYEKGFGYIVGITIGYQKKINDKFILDFFLGGGNHQGFYKGYNADGSRYDFATDYNKSGEWLAYRGGLMLSYKLN